MPSKPVLVFVCSTVVLLAVFLGQNHHLFRQPIREDGDFAANSILVNQAKQFRLLVGNYSRLQFNHPGPGILYVLAWSEIALYDLTRLVPAPHNAHMVGHMALNALLLGLSLSLLACHWRSLLAAAAALTVFLGYFGLTGVLSSHWMPHVYFAIYLTFLVAAASVAAGRPWHLVFMGLAGGLAVHGHVCFVAFVVPVSLFALFSLAYQHRFSLSALLREQRGPLLGFGLVLAIMVLPIAVHTLADYPGEIGKYLAYSRSKLAVGHPLADVLPFSLECLTYQLPHPKATALGVLGLLLLSLPYRAGSTYWRMPGALLAVCVVTAASFSYYAAKGVDDLQFTYLGIFFGSVLLLGLTVGVLGATRFLERPASLRVLFAGLLLLAAGYAAHIGQFRDLYEGSPLVARAMEVLPRQQRWRQPTIVLTTEEYAFWPEEVGLIVNLERMGKRVLLAEPYLEFMVTSRHTATLNDLEATGNVWCLGCVRPGSGQSDVLIQNEDAEILQYDPDRRYQLGTELTLGVRARPFLVSGWLRSGAAETKLTEGSNARLALGVGEVHRDVRLTVRGAAVLYGPRRKIEVDVVVNGVTLDHWVFDHGGQTVQRQALIPAAVLNQRSPAEVGFHLLDVKSPLELGLSADHRRLGLRVDRISLDDCGIVPPGGQTPP